METHCATATLGMASRAGCEAGAREHFRNGELRDVNLVGAGKVCVAPHISPAFPHVPRDAGRLRIVLRNVRRRRPDVRGNGRNVRDNAEHVRDNAEYVRDKAQHVRRITKDIRIGTRHVLNDAEDVPLQLRVRAIGPNEMEGPWSDLAEHLVP